LTDLRDSRETLLAAFSRVYLADREGNWLYDEDVLGYVKQE
jgi:hypothetical protein